MATIASRQLTAVGTQGAGHLQKVRGFFGAVAYWLRPYFGPMSLDRGNMLDRDKLAVNPDVVLMTRM